MAPTRRLTSDARSATGRRLSELADELWATGVLSAADLQSPRLSRGTGRAGGEEHALRGYDAVHLATALGIADPNLLIVTWDRVLARAAGECGHPVVPALDAK